MLDRIGPDNLEKRGFVHEGDFLFAANRHDTGEKTVLGKEFPAGGGYQEGVDLLEMLAHHPSTAKFIAREIAVRFVNDDPPQALVDKMAKTFIDRNGDIKQVLITMVCAPEFWSASALRSKIKSPFELAISTVRGLHATITQPYPLYQWITRMGQKMYYYQAPTGFPDKGQYWINTGSLLNRMNFGLALASRRIQGITFDLNALNNNHEPESAGAGLIVYGKLLMPERNLDQTVKQLSPMLNEPDLVTKVDAAAGKAPANQDVGMAPRKQGMTAQNPGMQNQDMAGSDAMASRNQGMASGDAGMASRSQGLTYADAGMTPAQEPGHANAKAVADNNSMLSQVVGILIGSPEYQRR